jgi:hypothetical protein
MDLSTPKTRNKYLPIFIFLIFLLSMVQSAMPLFLSHSIVRGDGVGYFAYLRSLVFDGDLNFKNEFTHYESAFSEDTQPITTTWVKGKITPTGMIPNSIPIA